MVQSIRTIKGWPGESWHGLGIWAKRLDTKLMRMVNRPQSAIEHGSYCVLLENVRFWYFIELHFVLKSVYELLILMVIR
jgi:hypothetical protein